MEHRIYKVRFYKMKKSNYLRLLKYVFFKKTKGPVQLIHFVTSKCNAKCEHCFYWKNLNKNNDLTLKEIEKITKTLPELYLLMISGGEPFIRKDLVDITYSYFKNTPMRKVTIPTNGLMTDKIKKDCVNILERCPGLELSIGISLDGPKEIHDKTRGVPGCFESAIKTFFELKKLRKNKNFKISIVSTLTPINQEKMTEFYRYVKNELEPDVFSLNLIRGSPKNPDMKKVSLHYFKEILKLESKELKNAKGFKNKIRNFIHIIRTQVIIDTIEKKKYVLPCYAALLTGVLSESGKVYPCELLTKPIADIKDFDYNFEKLWESKSAKDYSKFIINTKCFCTHECFLRVNILFNFKFLLKSFLKQLIRI
ncbi:radical SAM protein [Candidatus Micrarchaeota archaeon]|nr:radical SAM protein [Candidatus Micrarchaeota archaeon]